MAFSLQSSNTQIALVRLFLFECMLDGCIQLTRWPSLLHHDFALRRVLEGVTLIVYVS